MEKRWCLLLLVALLFSSFVFAEEPSGAWDDFADGGGAETSPTENNTLFENNTPEQTIIDEEDPVFVVKSQDNVETSYTEDFYQALWVGVGALVFFILFLYLFFRRPRNRWKRKYS